jgi:hypothetical protein
MKYKLGQNYFLEIVLFISHSAFFQTIISESIKNAFLRIKIPGDNDRIFFGAKGIKLSPDGDIIGDTKMEIA